jgi:hypothetical protein
MLGLRSLSAEAHGPGNSDHFWRIVLNNSAFGERETSTPRYRP